MTIDDPLLRALPTVEGYKLLPPCLVTGKLGGGGMGMLYRGYHTKLETDVAIKVLSPLVASQDERFVDRFQREARLAARIALADALRLQGRHLRQVRVQDRRRRCTETSG